MRTPSPCTGRIRVNLPNCPTPHKKGHPSQWQAEAALEKAWRRGRGSHLPCRAYQCRCGLWHLTSQPYNPRRSS